MVEVEDRSMDEKAREREGFKDEAPTSIFDCCSWLRDFLAQLFAFSRLSYSRTSVCLEAAQPCTARGVGPSLRDARRETSHLIFFIIYLISIAKEGCSGSDLWQRKGCIADNARQLDSQIHHRRQCCHHTSLRFTNNGTEMKIVYFSM